MGRKLLVYGVLFVFLSHFIASRDYYFNGQVEDADGNLMEDVRVENLGPAFTDEEYETDEDGRFGFEVTDSNACVGFLIIHLRFTKKGYKTFEYGEESIGDDDPQIIHVVLEAEDSERNSGLKEDDNR